MRVLMLSKALVVGEYQSKAEKMACRPDVDLTVVVPPAWRDERGELKLECAQGRGYRLLVAPVRLNGHFHTHFYPTIGSLINQAIPDIIHIDEEPYNFATWHAFRAAHRAAPRAHLIFFTWQNIMRVLLPPFSWMEQDVFRRSSLALAGSSSAQEVLERKGFAGRINIIPQFGVDELKFSPSARADRTSRLVVGLAGRLVPEKGAHILLRALASIQGDWELQIIGSGPEQARLRALADELGIAERVGFIPWKPSAEMPEFYRGLDILVTPSLTRPNWKEQFGRVLVEAMACGVPVIGSDSGEIPKVVGDAGLLVPEGDVEPLADALRSLAADPARRTELGIKARRRVLENYTQDRIAALTVDAYRSLL